jgi:hypothetical protein
MQQEKEKEKENTESKEEKEKHAEPPHKNIWLACPGDGSCLVGIPNDEGIDCFNEKWKHCPDKKQCDHNCMPVPCSVCTSTIPSYLFTRDGGKCYACKEYIWRRNKQVQDHRLKRDYPVLWMRRKGLLYS